MNAKTPITFVLNEGNLIEIARVRFVLYGEPPMDEAIALLLGDQLDDGGFSPSWAPGYSSLDATCFRLAQAEQMGLDPALLPQIDRALDFIKRLQNRDGSWMEEPEVTEVAPPWVKPGDAAATMYLTSNCAYVTSIYRGTDNTSRLGSGYLQLRMAPDGKFPSFWHTHWLAAALWQKLGETKPRDVVLRYLALNLNQLHTSNLAAMLNAFYVAGMKPSTALIYEAAKALERQQNQYGVWGGETDPDRDINTTIEALRSLKLVNRYEPPPINQLDRW